MNMEMGTHSRASHALFWGIVAPSILLAGAFALVGMLRWETAVEWGGWIRRPGDVTADRHHRLVQAGRFFAIALGGLSLAAIVQRSKGLAFLDGTLEECRSWKRQTGAVADPAESTRPDRRGFDGAFWAILAIGLAIRLRYLDVPIAYDEAYSFLNFARRPWYEAIADYNNTNNHVLNTLLMHFSYRLFGMHEWALRLGALAAGMLLIGASYGWAAGRAGKAAGRILSAAIAGIPLMIDYSVNARGYIDVAAFAVVLDASFDRIARADRPAHLPWLSAGLAMILGMWAMPIMIYPLVGSLAWLWLTPGDRWFGRQSFARRTVGLLVWGVIASLIVLLLYFPAYVFRGLLAFENPFVNPMKGDDWMFAIPAAWRGAYFLWFRGLVTVGSVFCVVGALASGRPTPNGSPIAGTGRVWAIFLATAGLMALHRVAPPPRVFVILAPFAYLVATLGVVELMRWLGRIVDLRGNLGGGIVVALLLVGSGIQGLMHPEIIDPEQRARSLLSVEEVIVDLRGRLPANLEEPAFLLAPLPCDLPVLYYAAKHNVSFRLNALPSSLVDPVWLIAVSESDPSATLSDQVVRLGDVAELREGWERVARFNTLDLWRWSPTGRP